MYSKNLKTIRQKLDLSIAKMAKKLDMPQSTLTSYERNDRTPSVEFISRLYKILNVNTNWFVSGEGEIFNSPKKEFKEDEFTVKVENILRKNGLIS